MTARRNDATAVAFFPDPTQSRLGRQVAAGVAAYARSSHRWVFRVGENDLRRLGRWGPQAMVALLSPPELIEPVRKAAKEWNIPLVNALHPVIAPGLPQVFSDEQAVGRLAARHLVDCGLNLLAFVGWRSLRWSEQRQAGFLAQARRSGHNPRRLELEGRVRMMGSDRKLQKWLLQLPKPVGVFACHDCLGYSVTEACRITGLKIPDEVAVVSVDNDPLLCELCAPTLSSIIMPAEQIGYQAGVILGQMLAGRKVSDRPVILPPSQVAQRASSDLFARTDPEVATAIRYIRAGVQAGSSINVWDVLQQVPVSRRTLENRFKTATGRTPLQEIQYLRMERAKVLLESQTMPVGKIARQLGYKNANRLVETFRKFNGMTPAQFRDRRLPSVAAKP